MKREQNEEETRARSAYVPPLIEMFVTDEDSLLATQSFSGGHGDSVSDEGGGGAGTGFSDNDDLSGGIWAKSMILEREFSFTDPWDE